MLRRLLSKIFGRQSERPYDALFDLPEPTALAKGSNQLRFDLYARMRGAAGNLALSPASISAALAMTYGGAKGDTASQMRAVAHFTEEPEAAMSPWGAELSRLTAPGRSMKLRVANRLFGERTYALDAAYMERASAAFGAPLEPLDFRTAPDAARSRINRWVEEQTEDRIKDLLSDASISPETRLVLVNAIYFLADWATPFEKQQTSRQPFYSSPANEKRVWMMTRTAHLPYAQIEGARIVELLYEEGQASMSRSAWPTRSTPYGPISRVSRAPPTARTGSSLEMSCTRPS